MLERILEVQHMHQILIADASKKNIDLKNSKKLGLIKNATIHKNIQYESIKIKVSIQIGTRPSFHLTI